MNSWWLLLIVPASFYLGFFSYSLLCVGPCSDEKAKFVEWIKDNVDDRVVPGDEENGDALAFNLIHLVQSGPFVMGPQKCGYIGYEEGRFPLGANRYQYLPDQDEEIESWGRDRVKW